MQGVDNIRRPAGAAGAVIAALIAGGLTEIAHAQFGTSHGQVVQVTDARPLAALARDLTGRYGVLVSYEDPLTYAFEGDFDGTVETERRKGFPSRPARELRATTLSFTAEALAVGYGYPQRPAERSSVARILQGAIDNHAANGNPGRFKILETASGLDIVPVASRDISGEFAPVESLLDTRITFPEVKGMANPALAAFTRALAAASGKTVAAPFEGLLVSGPVSANNEVARDVLARIVNGLRLYGATPETVNQLFPVDVAWTLTTQPGLAPPHDATYRIDLRVGGLDTRYSPARNIPGRVVPIPRSAEPRP